MLIEELNSRFASVGGVQFAAGSGGFVHAVVSTPFADAHVYLHGAHVTHYQPIGGTPVLFTSPHSQFAPGKAIRGGVPVIFPWFGPRGGHPAAPEHGFARVAEWSVESVERAIDGAVILVLRLDRTETTRTLRRRLTTARAESTTSIRGGSADPMTHPASTVRRSREIERQVTGHPTSDGAGVFLAPAGLPLAVSSRRSHCSLLGPIVRRTASCSQLQRFRAPRWVRRQRMHEYPVAPRSKSGSFE